MSSSDGEPADCFKTNVLESEEEYEVRHREAGLRLHGLINDSETYGSHQYQEAKADFDVIKAEGLIRGSRGHTEQYAQRGWGIWINTRVP